MELQFGIFQALMPAIGYFLGNAFQNLVTNIDHWIAFVLLVLIGANMIREALSKDKDNNFNDNVDSKTMLILAIATSIDALAIGITFAFLNVNYIHLISSRNMNLFLYYSQKVFIISLKHSRSFEAMFKIKVSRSCIIFMAS